MKFSPVFQRDLFLKAWSYCHKSIILQPHSRWPLFTLELSHNTTCYTEFTFTRWLFLTYTWHAASTDISKCTHNAMKQSLFKSNVHSKIELARLPTFTHAHNGIRLTLYTHKYIQRTCCVNIFYSTPGFTITHAANQDTCSSTPRSLAKESMQLNHVIHQTRGGRQKERHVLSSLPLRNVGAALSFSRNCELTVILFCSLFISTWGSEVPALAHR